MEKSNKLYILWTNADILTSEKMVMMYATNSMLNQWWDAVTVIIWGATSMLVAENEMIQNKIAIASHAGVQFSACKACADQLGVTDKLIDLGIEVQYWGEGLTDILKDDEKLITI
jgi:hypothetical protein